MKIGIGLVVKGGKQFIDEWLSNLEILPVNDVFVVDNGADEEVRQKLINHKYTKRYLVQNLPRNQSRDYQKILQMAREENCQWIWNLDIDEHVPEINKNEFLSILLNWRDESIGCPLFEMRGDKNHYVMVKDMDGNLKHARLVHKIYKVLSHFKFNEMDIHGSSIPHNCKSGDIYFVPIHHYGHMTKKLRQEKRKLYKTLGFKDLAEQETTWLEEDESKIVIKKWEGMNGFG